jgi:hypothetical protein
MMTLEQLNAIYEAADFGNNAKYSGSVAPMAVNNPAGLQTINIAQAPMVLPVTQSNGLDYLLNQGGDQNQNFSMEEYEKAFANQNKKPTDNFLTRALSGVGDKFSGIMDNKYVQGARNMGSMITNPLIGGLSFLASKVDKFNTLPYVDQQFIKENMAYRNPNSGLPQDPFGINTRSALGNYAEFVGKESEKLDAAVEKATAKYEALGYTPAQIAKQLSNLLERQSFYGDKNLDYNKKKQAFDKTIEIKEIEREKRRIEAREAAEREAAAMAEVRAQQAKDEAVYRTQPGQYGGDNRQQEREQAGPGYSGSGTAAEMGSFKKGGRIGYGKGGIVSL